MGRLVDVFCYNGEPIVALRLALLSPIVQKFVIVEARHPHNPTAPPKDELFINKNRHIFDPYRHKIQFVVIDEFPECPPGFGKHHAHWHWIRADVPGSEEAWWREMYQRDSARQGLEHGDIVVCGDADEIPDPSKLAAIAAVVEQGCHCISLEMDLYVGDFYTKKNEKWTSAFVTPWHPDMSLTTLRATPIQDVVCDAGWHCTNFFASSEDWLRKERSFAHVELAARGVSLREHHSDTVHVEPPWVAEPWAEINRVPSATASPETVSNP